MASGCVKYLRPPPTREEVERWIRHNWKHKFTGEPKLRYEVKLQNPFAIGMSNSWNVLDNKRIDIVFEGDDEIWLIETDPTILQGTVGQLPGYEIWYAILIGRDEIRKVGNHNTRVMLNKRIAENRDTYRNPDANNSFYLPGIDTNKPIHLGVFVRESDFMLEEVCLRKGIRVIVIPE